jgi:hypothetical protein
MQRLARRWRTVLGIAAVAASAHAERALAQANPCPPEDTPPIAATIVTPVATDFPYEIVPQLQPGDDYYTDRPKGTHVITALPPEPEVLCARWVRTKNSDKSASTDDFLQIQLGDLGERRVRAYVGYDTRALSVPNWLVNGFTDTGLEIDITEPDPNQEFALWRSKLSFGSGDTLVLGGNKAAGASFSGNQGSNYIVVLAVIGTPLPLPFGPVELDITSDFEFVLDLEALPPRPNVRISFSPASFAEQVSLLDDCTDFNDLISFIPRQNPENGIVIDFIDTHPFAEDRVGVTCRLTLLSDGEASGLYELTITAFTDPPPAAQQTPGELSSADFTTEGNNVRWVYDGTQDLGTCQFTSDPDSPPVTFEYVPTGTAEWDCCTWRFDGVDEVTSSIGQITFQNTATTLPPDADGDQILDPCDNCPGVANATPTCRGGSFGGQTCSSNADCTGGFCFTSGTCSAGSKGSPCHSDAQCGAGGRCSKDQEDLDADGRGDVCDNCPGVANANQANFDGDARGDACDPDDDDDGRPDGQDSAPKNPNACADTDGDGCDDCSSGSFDPAGDGPDDDGDGICNAGEGSANLTSTPSPPVNLGALDRGTTVTLTFSLLPPPTGVRSFATSFAIDDPASIVVESCDSALDASPLCPPGGSTVEMEAADLDPPRTQPFEIGSLTIRVANEAQAGATLRLVPPSGVIDGASQSLPLPELEIAQVPEPGVGASGLASALALAGLAATRRRSRGPARPCDPTRSRSSP